MFESATQISGKLINQLFYVKRSWETNQININILHYYGLQNCIVSTHMLSRYQLYAAEYNL